jgi:predicted deacylase
MLRASVAVAFTMGTLGLASAGPAWALSFDHYHSQAEIDAYMHDLASTHPDLVQYVELGRSEQGREIGYVVVTTAPAGAPVIYFNGTHHGDEWSSTESTLAVIDHLVENAASPEVAPLLAQYAFLLQPLVNPDGHAARTREDPHGRDPNRDYSYPERDDDHSFEVPFIALVKQLVDSVHPRAAVAYHSGEEAVLWPWCYAPSRSNDHDVFYTLSRRSAEAMGVRNYEQSYFDYPTEGEFTDYAYMRHDTLAVTVEVSNAKTPPVRQLAGVVARAVDGAMAFVEGVRDLDAGVLVVQSEPYRPFRGFRNRRAVVTGGRLE